MSFFCGFDFGTSNTVVTLISDAGGGQKVFADSSVLFLPDCGHYAQRRFVGQKAVDEYLESNMNGRFIQSIKSVLPDPAFVQTNIFEKMYTPVEMAAMIIRDFKNRIEDFLGSEIDGAVFGRPVKFSDVPENDALAEERLLAAADRCGFARVEFQYEPVAAASRYTNELIRGTFALVCDFGFGTSYESFGKMLPVPVHIYRMICNWNRIAFLKTMQYRDDLKYIRNGAADRAAVDRLIQLIDDDLGFALFQAIRSAKHELSENDTAAVRFFEHGIELKERIHESEFDGYIKNELDDIETAVSKTLEGAGVGAGEIRTVFLTGGSSMVKQVRRQIERCFTEADIRLDTDRFNSVSYGLAVEARNRGLSVSDEPFPTSPNR